MGFGDIVATTWYTKAFVTIEMLVSVMFTTVIFAKGLSTFAGVIGGRENNPRMIPRVKTMNLGADGEATSLLNWDDE